MRLPIADDLDSRNGVANKDARLTNMLKEADEGRELAVIRPGLVSQVVSSGAGGGLVQFNGDLLTVFGTTLGRYSSGAIGSLGTVGAGVYDFAQGPL